MSSVAFRVRGANRRASAFRAVALLGTALGCTLAMPAQAEKVVFNGSGDFSSTRADTLTDTAQVVDARTTAGNLLLNFSGINVTGNTQGAGIFSQVTGAGNITINSGTVAATPAGTASIYGVDARTSTGNISITSNSSNTSNANNSSRGLYAITTSGAITINSQFASGNSAGIFTGFNGGNGASTTTITSVDARGTGTGRINAIVGQGAVVNITSGTASLTNAAGNQGAAIFTNSDTSVIKSTTVNLSGLNQSGIEINADLGTSSIESGTVTAAQSSTAIKGNITAFSPASNTAGATIKSGTITLNGANSQGINWVSASTGLTAIDSGTITANAANTVGILGSSAGNSTIKSGTINLNSTNATGITWNATGAATTSIDSGTIAGTGNNVFTGINVTGATGAIAIKSDAINGAGGSNIVASTDGAITINSNTLTNASIQANYLNFGNATAGAITITSGTLTATTGLGTAISGSSAGALTIDSGSITGTTTASANSNTGGLIGIAGSAVGTAAATVRSGTIAFTGPGNSQGITVQAGSGAPLSITSGAVTVTGNGYGILGSTSSGPLSITSGDVTTVGNIRYAGAANGVVGTPAQARYSDGIQGYSLTGAITINSTGTVSTAGNTARGITAEAGRVFTDFGNSPSATASTAAITINNSGTVKTTGANAVGIYVLADENAVTLASANVTTSGANSHGISVAGGRPANGNTAAIGGTGAINVTTGNVAVTGTGSDAVRLVSNTGPITANVTGVLSSTNGTGLFIDPPAAVVVNVAAGGSARGSVNGISTVGTTNTITNLGSVSNSGTGAAIVATGTTSLSNSGTITAGSGGVAVQLGATNDAVTLRTGSAVTGAIAGGGGTDTATLAGAGTTTTPTQTIARFTGFDSLNVASGYWTAAPANSSAFNSATVATGASLELAYAGAGLGIAVPSIVDNGTVVVRSTSGATGSTFGTTTVTGSGAVLLTGAGTVALDGSNSLQNAGGITVDNGVTALLTGTQSGNFVTAAGGTLQIGNGGTTGIFTGNLTDNGTLILAHSDDYTFGGALTGTGSIVKQGAGKVTFGTGYAFTGTTTINGGSVKLSTPVAATTELAVEGSGQLDLSGTQQTVAELAGTSRAASVNIAGGSLTVNQATSTSFAGNLTGNGSLAKTGSGTLNLTGINTYTGPTTVGGGTLAVNGSIASAVTVNSGGRLGGTGSVGGASVVSGGTYAPGNSIGTQTVNGNVAFAAGSIFEVEANADGRSDRIVATGTAALTGGTVSVLAESGTFNKVTTYNILTANGGVTGRFTNITSNFAFLSPLLDYTATAVNLTLGRNDVSFGSIATSPNQLAVANAVAARGLGNAVFNAVLVQTTAGGQAAFDALGGELFATVPTVLVDEGRRVRDAVLDRAAVGGEGLGVWASGMRNRAESDSRNGVAEANADRRGVVSGIDFGRDSWRIGAAAGYIDSDIDVGARASHADVKSKLVSVYGGWTGGRLTAQAGGSYTWHDIDTTRTIATVGLAGTQAGSFDAKSTQGFAELSYKLLDGPFTASPFVGYAHVRTKSDGVAEAGNAAALIIAADTRDVDFATFGLRAGGSAPISSTATFLPKMSVSYQHAWGDRDGPTLATFGGTGAAFGVMGARLGSDTFNIDGGFDVAMGAFRIGAAAYASTSTEWSDFGAKVGVGFSF